MKNFHIVFLSAFLALTLSLMLFQPILAQPQADALELIREVNALRAEQNLPPYQTNSVLMLVAQAQADYVAQTGVVSRFDAAGLRPYQRAVKAGYAVAGDLAQGGLFSEGIASGANLSAADVVQKWAKDSTRDVFSSEFKDIGVGVATTNGVTYYVLDVGSRVADVAQTPVDTSTPTLPPGAVVTTTPLEDGSIHHIVQPKEALWSIALAYNMSVDDLKHLNGLKTNDIFEGQNLLVYKPKPKDLKTPTPGVTFTATLGIPSSTPTQPVTPTITSTFTPQPTAPASSRTGGATVGIIVVVALLGAGLGAWLGKKKKE